MKKLKATLSVIGIAQLVLGGSFLFFPLEFANLMGITNLPQSAGYLLGMLAARFIAYGVGMFAIARNPMKERFWIGNMILVQCLDLAAGLWYTAAGTTRLATTALPMFDATVFIAALALTMPKRAHD